MDDWPVWMERLNLSLMLDQVNEEEITHSMPAGKIDCGLDGVDLPVAIIISE